MTFKNRVGVQGGYKHSHNLFQSPGVELSHECKCLKFFEHLNPDNNCEWLIHGCAA